MQNCRKGVDTLCFSYLLMC